MRTEEISYYALTLQQFLNENHPELKDDQSLITTRSDRATEGHEEAIKEGSNQIEATEIANIILFEGLHFSKYNTIINILWNEFDEIIAQSEAEEYAVRLMPNCIAIFEKYSLNDEFAYSPEFEQLYSELTGVIMLWVEDNEL